MISMLTKVQQVIIREFSWKNPVEEIADLSKKQKLYNRATVGT